MRKHFLKYFIFLVILFLIGPVGVKASFGDLRYEITSVSVGNSSITFEGWAFIHRTNNFNEVIYNGKNVVSGGDHKIRIDAYNLTTKTVIDSISVKGKNEPNYNFYCELFDTVGNRVCEAANYEKKENNKCTNNNSGNSVSATSCYYEDIAFSVTFKNVNNWNVSSSDKIAFRISASNNDFESKLKNPNGNSYYASFKYDEYEGDYYTKPESIYVSESVYNSNKYVTDYIIVDTSSFSNQVAFIAKDGILKFYSEMNNMLCSFGKTSDDGVNEICEKDKNFLDYHIRGTYPDNGNAFQCNRRSDGKINNIFNLAIGKITGYDNGHSNTRNKCQPFLGNCEGTYNYAIYYETHKNKQTACPSDKQDKIAIAVGSHVKVSGDVDFKINVEGGNKCEVTDPDKNNGVLQCNGGKNYSSTCEELSVSTSEGGARVKIEQTGNVSSVLTPDRLYAGGGFNFGIVYYNTIKWSYVSGQSINSNLHNAVTEVMNSKIKDYELYIAGINIPNLQMDGKTFNMVKQCTTSNKNKDYYDKELTVSCLFTIPSSTIDKVGNVSYTYSSGVNINNKYYTPMNYNGNYKITADIVGMDRITDNAAKRDSKESGKKWTGDWSDTFTNCQINLYTLISGIPKFIYRPIDIINPFPNRNAGINWFDWYNITRNKDRLENTYSGVDKVDYTVTLDNNAITDIKNYNKNNNYLEWDSIDKVTNESSFITEKDYIVRGGN